LRRAFGALPDWALPRIRRARPEELEAWIERVLDARTVEALIDKNT
jgi:hypothetical protein